MKEARRSCMLSTISIKQLNAAKCTGKALRKLEEYEVDKCSTYIGDPNGCLQRRQTTVFR